MSNITSHITCCGHPTCAFWFLVVSSSRQRFINCLFDMQWVREYDSLTRPRSTSQPTSTHYHKADLYVLALRVVAARVYVILGGSFMSQINGTDLNVVFRVTRDSLQCWDRSFYTKRAMPCQGLEPKTLTSALDVLTSRVPTHHAHSQNILIYPWNLINWVGFDLRYWPNLRN